jgi:hypothetical protein
LVATIRYTYVVPGASPLTGNETLSEPDDAPALSTAVINPKLVDVPYSNVNDV